MAVAPCRRLALLPLLNPLPYSQGPDAMALYLRGMRTCSEEARTRKLFKGGCRLGHAADATLASLAGLPHRPRPGTLTKLQGAFVQW